MHAPARPKVLFFADSVRPPDSDAPLERRSVKRRVLDFLVNSDVTIVEVGAAFVSLGFVLLLVLPFDTVHSASVYRELAAVMDDSGWALVCGAVAVLPVLAFFSGGLWELRLGSLVAHVGLFSAMGYKVCIANPIGLATIWWTAGTLACSLACWRLAARGRPAR